MKNKNVLWNLLRYTINLPPPYSITCLPVGGYTRTQKNYENRIAQFYPQNIFCKNKFT